MPVASSPPSSVTASAVFESSTRATRFTCTENALAVACGSAPPPVLVAVSALNSASEPSAASSVLPPAEAVAASSSVATCTVSVACPVNVTFGVAPSAPEIATPLLMLLPAFFASDQSAGTTPSPPILSGTTTFSPSPSLRFKLTVNAALPVSAMAPEPVRASDATVTSSSVMVNTSRFAVLEITAPFKSRGSSGSLKPDRLNTTVSSGSSTVSPSTRR